MVVGELSSGNRSNRAGNNRSNRSSGDGSATDSTSPATAGNRSNGTDVAPGQPTELILDFSAPGRDVRRPLTRRGHVKSRLGCLSCKRRRVKCDERHPICGQCKRLKLSCSYPPEMRSHRVEKEQQQEQQEQDLDEEVEQQAQIATPVPTSSATKGTLPPSIGSGMKLDHLAFYHQFLTVAYPPIPIKEASAWADCAAMSHHYDYLAHAVLAIGASHLTVNTSANWRTEALHHRSLALGLINERLNKPIETSAEGDALMGALICLSGQSSLLEDSLHEYVALIRGSYLISQTIVLPRNASIWKSITDSSHAGMLESMVEQQAVDLTLVEEFQDYTASLTKICTKPHELQYQGFLHQAITSLPTDPVQSIRAFVALFLLPALLDHATFSDFVREDNIPAHLLLANMFLIDYLIGQTCFPKKETPKCGGRKGVLIAWIHRLMGRLPEEYRDFGDFPLRFCEVLSTYDARYLFSP